MAASIKETYQSRSVTAAGDNSRATWTCIIYDEPDEDAALALLASERPDVLFGNLFPSSGTLEPLGNGCWNGKVDYNPVGTPPQRESGDSWVSSLQGGTGGSTQHITHSLATVAAYPAGSAAVTDYKQAINVADDDVGGVDVPARQFRFTVTRLVPDAAFTSSHVTNVYACTGCVNSAAYQPHYKMPSFAAGELLLEDYRFSQKTADVWEEQFFFSATPNTTLVHPDVGEIEKRGWDYCWFHVIKKQVTGADDKKFLVTVADKAYVEQVLHYVNFSALG